MVDRRRAAPMQRGFNRVFNAAFRMRKGKLAFRGAPALILHTVGRRSASPRQTPLLYLDLGDGRAAVVASNGGDDRHPAWYHNLLAEPDVEAELAGARRTYTATVADPDTRAELWPRLVGIYGSYASYQTKTPREIPVVILTPR